MKIFLLIAVLAALSVTNEAAVIQKGVTIRTNLILGYVGYGDRLLYRSYFSKSPMVNAVQSQDIAYRGNSNTRITSIQVTEVGYTQYATAYLLAGGIGWSNATIRLQSARGYGYYYQVEIWGR